MRRVFASSLPGDAELARSLLANYGIEAYLVGIGAAPPEECSASPAVWVARDEDEERAIALIKQHRDPPPNEGPPWQCPDCGEENQGGFPICWNCGAAKDA
jgi:hypothetical protein